MRYFLVSLLIICPAIVSGEPYQVDYISISKSAEPFQIYKDDRYSGIITDVMEKILEHNTIIKYHNLPFVRMQQYMIRKKFKNWINYGSKHWVTSPQSWRLSGEPIFIAKNVLITLNDFSYNNQEDLYGKTVILIRGFIYPGLADLIKEGKVKDIRFENYEAGIRGVMGKRGTGFVGMKQRVLYTLKQMGLKKEAFTLQDISELIPQYGIHFSFSREFPDELLNSMNKELKKLKSNGFVDQVIKKYTE